MLKLTTFIYIGLILGATQAGAEDYVIIANKEVTETSISKTDLKNLMLGNKTNFAGQAADICLWGAKEGDGFFQDVLGVSKAQFNQEWVKKELTGAGRAPRSRNSVEQVIECVATSKGGLGFVSKSSADKVDSKIKVLNLTD